MVIILSQDTGIEGTSVDKDEFSAVNNDGDSLVLLMTWPFLALAREASCLPRLLSLSIISVTVI